MPDDYKIHLNFLPIIGNIPPFRVFRKLRNPEDARPDDGVSAYSLPKATHLEERDHYWIRPDPHPDFHDFLVQPNYNNDLTCWALFRALCDSAHKTILPDAFSIPPGFIHELNLRMISHPEGDELLVVQPYFLRVRQQFGCLVDFHFRLREGAAFSRRIQQLSLSLAKNGRRNVDYYLDRFTKIATFLAERRSLFSSLTLPGPSTPFTLSPDFIDLPAQRLRTRIYLFAEGKESRSQFTGLANYGPLQALATPPHLLFVFREQDRHVARTLAMALRGPTKPERYGFPGFEGLFKSPITIDSNPFILQDFSPTSFSAALDRVKAERTKDQGTIPIFVLPEGDDNGYHNHKAVFAHEGIPTQVCTLPIIQDENALKWAIANIALQIFCKSGGQPWKVRPTAERSLIIGISQSHKVRHDGNATRVEKYFAFSVMTDNSGLFQRIQILGEAQNQSDYLTQLRKSLKDILTQEATDFGRVVIHTSFKLKYREIDAIQETVEAAVSARDDGPHFAVVKVNHKSRFFGVNRSINCLVPYEATSACLGKGEYLVWFEGVFPDKPTVTKAFPGPTHLKFLRVANEQGISDADLLQDLINLSGANWRGFNAKSAPVSVFYCHLIADLVHDFHERGLVLPAVHDIRPWFL